MAVGILVAGYLSVPSGALFVLLAAAVLFLRAMWLLRRGYGAWMAMTAFFFLIGYLRAYLPDVSLIPNSLVAWSGGASRNLADALSHLDLSPTTNALLHAMLLGQRDAIMPELKELYRQTGAAHILALSGLHLTILFGLIHFLFLHIVAYRMRYFIGCMAIVLMWGYALLTGFPISLCRASLMMTLLIIGQMRLTGTDSWHALGLTAFTLLLISPSSLYDVGFQLSFVAVAGILLFFRPLADVGLPSHRWVRRIWQTFLVSLSAQLGVMPLLLHYFHRFPLSGILLSPIYILLPTSIMYMALTLCLLAPIGMLPLLRPVLEVLVAAQHGLMSLTTRLPWDGAVDFCLPWMGVVFWYAALLCLLTPLEALRKPEVPQCYFRLALFFRAWPYILAALVYAIGVYGLTSGWLG